jgi:hypothetical protein
LAGLLRRPVEDAPVFGGRSWESRGAVIVSEASRVTSELLWRGAAVALLMDIPLLVMVGRFVSAELFRGLKWYLASAAFLIYALLWGVFGSFYFWDSVYHAVFPAWSRWLLPAWFGFLFGMVAILFWRITAPTAKWQAVWFVLLGGVVSLVGHGIGIKRGLLRVPLLSQASPASALVFGVFEFVFYWSAIVGLGAAGKGLARAAHRSHA